MCEPTSIAYVAGMVIVAVAGVAEADAQKQAGRANAQIAENNARLSDASAKDVANLGAREQQQAAWRTRALIGKQKAGLAANMIDSGEGSAFDLVGETALFGGAEQSALSMDAARKAWGFQSEGLNYRNAGAQAKWMGKTQSRITLLSTAGKVMTMYGSMAKPASGSWGGSTGTSPISGVNTAGSSTGWQGDSAFGSYGKGWGG